MKRLVEFELEDGGSIVVEVDEPDRGGGTVRAGRESDIPEKARLGFEEAVDKIRPAAESIIKRLRDLTDSPDNVGVEFGLKLTGTAGAVIASTAVEANIKVTLAWNRRHERNAR